MSARDIGICLAVLLLLTTGCGAGDRPAIPTAPPAATPVPSFAPNPSPTATPAVTRSPTPLATTAPESTTAAPPTEPVDPAAGVGDSFYPLLGNSGYDVIHYDIDLDVEPSANTIDAVTTLTAIATEDLDQFNLDFHGLEVEAVSVDGTDAKFARDGQEMTILPVEPVSSGAQFTVAVSYSGTPEPVDGPGVPFIPLGWHASSGVIYTASQPSGR